MTEKKYPIMLTVNKALLILDILSKLEQELIEIIGDELLAEAALLETDQDLFENEPPTPGLDEIPL